ncbi:hypothetical protein ACIHFC_29520 [Streptomyces sp. NPDC052013]|uniref:hypothetical protein n=1 Tax=Streptomyces sp. NPDC052013 TaxID=3365679 RepID=UPI0037D7C663
MEVAMNPSCGTSNSQAQASEEVRQQHEALRVLDRFLGDAASAGLAAIHWRLFPSLNIFGEIPDDASIDSEAVFDAWASYLGAKTQRQIQLRLVSLKAVAENVHGTRVTVVLAANFIQRSEADG